jgi:acyl-CoA hydrolase
MTSINTAVELDVTGQVCSESIGHGEISGTGGASDTHVGAQQSSGGRGIIALRSTTKDGARSKIVCGLAPGAKVTIHRNDVDTIITEYGVAELIGKNAKERAQALIAIAHPKFRDELTFESKRLGYL